MYRLLVIALLLIFCKGIYAQGASDSTDQLPKKPMLALGLSAVVPGAGQFYSESWIYGSLFAAANVYFYAQMYQANQDYLTLRDKYEKTGRRTDLDDEMLTAMLADFEADYQNRREKRNLNTWYLGLAYAMNLMNAYVEATLFEFDERIDANLTFGQQLYNRQVTPTAYFTIHF
jgi:hypothetical protein